MEDRNYHNQPRDDVIAHLDLTPNTLVLDAGCGTGALGRALIRRGCRRVFGIEFDSEAAAEARNTYEKVLVGDIDQLVFDFDAVRFDYVVCADILEHLRDPWQVLGRLRPLLKADGVLVASIPNMRNVATISELIMGDFKYAQWGIQDKTHLRFFTLKSILRMFSECGFDAHMVGANRDANAQAILDLWQSHQMSERLRDVLKLMVGGDYRVTQDDLAEYLVIQFLIEARKTPSA